MSEESKSRKISLNKQLIDKVEKFIKENTGYGYPSIARFTEDAVRRHAFNLNIPLKEEREAEIPHRLDGRTRKKRK